MKPVTDHSWTLADLRIVAILTVFNVLWLGILLWLILGLWLNFAGPLVCFSGAFVFSTIIAIRRQYSEIEARAQDS